MCINYCRIISNPNNYNICISFTFFIKQIILQVFSYTKTDILLDAYTR